jgi:hypothetical protein
MLKAAVHKLVIHLLLDKNLPGCLVVLAVQLAEVQAMLVALSSRLPLALANFSHKGDSHGR